MKALGAHASDVIPQTSADGVKTTEAVLSSEVHAFMPNITFSVRSHNFAKPTAALVLYYRHGY